MSSHYLIDHFSTPIADAPIVDVTEPSDGLTVTNGNFVVRVPDSVQIGSPPSTLSNLLTQKYAGLLARYAGYSNIVYDDMLDATGVDFDEGPSGIFGERGNVALAPLGTLDTVVVPLALTPSAAVLTWEVFTYTYTDPKGGRFTRTYNELVSSPATATVEVSFNGGDTFESTTDGATLLIEESDQGDELVVRFTNVTSNRLYIGSWALVY